jgi:hypothetical protein
MNTLKRSATIAASAERVFAYVEDIRNLARHMSESPSAPMMGSKLKLEILSREATGVGALYRYSGRIMGLSLDFSEVVTRYVPGREKVWRTVGDPRLQIVDSYEMGVVVEPLNAKLTIRFDYQLPGRGVWRRAGLVLAGPYGRWCLNSMVNGAKEDLEQTLKTIDPQGRDPTRFSGSERKVQHD